MVNTIVRIAANAGLELATAPTIKLNTTISNTRNVRNHTSRANVFQRKIKNPIVFIFIYYKDTDKLFNIQKNVVNFVC